MAEGLDQPSFGFEAFYERGLAQSAGTRRLTRKSKGARYTAGPLKGKTEGEGYEYARDLYAKLPDSVRQKYEQRGSMGDVRSGREIERQRQYNAQLAGETGQAPGLPGGQTPAAPQAPATASTPKPGYSRQSPLMRQDVSKTSPVDGNKFEEVAPGVQLRKADISRMSGETQAPTLAAGPKKEGSIIFNGKKQAKIDGKWQDAPITPESPGEGTPEQFMASSKRIEEKQKRQAMTPAKQPSGSKIFASK